MRRMMKMINKDKAFDFLNEEYKKILPEDSSGMDEDSRTIDQIESQIYEKLESMIEQKFKDFESKVNDNNVDSAPINEVETKDQEDSTDGINED